MEKKEEQKPHSLTLDNRNKCNLSGVTKVVSATENCIVLQTSLGQLIINGTTLKLTSFSQTNGTLSFQGEVSALKYGSKTSALKKIFG